MTGAFDSCQRFRPLDRAVVEDSICRVVSVIYYVIVVSIGVVTYAVVWLVIVVKAYNREVVILCAFIFFILCNKNNDWTINLLVYNDNIYNQQKMTKEELNKLIRETSVLIECLEYNAVNNIIRYEICRAHKDSIRKTYKELTE